jgi:hypothetical protein
MPSTARYCAATDRGGAARIAAPCTHGARFRIGKLAQACPPSPLAPHASRALAAEEKIKLAWSTATDLVLGQLLQQAEKRVFALGVRVR